ncbi:MAG: hypothetical protein ABSG03_28775 [Bryobacteraceae bacterium]
MSAADLHGAIEAVWRIESARVIAGLFRLTRDVGLAEDLAQEPRRPGTVAATGVSANPGAWLTATAKRRTIDLFRRNNAKRKHEELARELEALEQTSLDLHSTGPGGRLRQPSSPSLGGPCGRRLPVGSGIR